MHTFDRSQIESELKNVIGLPDYSEIQRILKEEDILEVLMKESQKLIVGEDIPIQIIWLTISSCLVLNQPFGVLIRSPSSVGKSYLINKILESLPKEFDALEIDKEGGLTIKAGFGFVSFHKITLAALTRITQKNRKHLRAK